MLITMTIQSSLRLNTYKPFTPNNRRTNPHHPTTPSIKKHSSSRLHALGDDTVQSWLDLAGFVATSTSSRTPYDQLADKIGRDCYIDVAGWHLYLKDVKIGGQTSLAQAIAAKLGSQIQGQGKFDDRIVDDLLKVVPIKLGQGKTTVSLAQVMPSGCVMDLVDICNDYARDL